MVAEQYIRTLSQDESKQVWKQLQDRWGPMDDYWYPLMGRETPLDVIVFEDEWFYHGVPLDALKSILKAHRITRIWEIREDLSGYEMDCELLDLSYDGTEGYWTSESIDWLIYASHEHSLTIAGKWLIAATKALWPHWKEHIYTTYDFKRPQP